VQNLHYPPLGFLAGTSFAELRRISNKPTHDTSRAPGGQAISLLAAPLYTDLSLVPTYYSEKEIEAEDQVNLLASVRHVQTVKNRITKMIPRDMQETREGGQEHKLIAGYLGSTERVNDRWHRRDEGECLAIPNSRTAEHHISESGDSAGRIKPDASRLQRRAGLGAKKCLLGCPLPEFAGHLSHVVKFVAQHTRFSRCPKNRPKSADFLERDHEGEFPDFGGFCPVRRIADNSS
jgi:hypothetical protein